MGSKISVIVVDDHPLVREGVVHVFNRSPDIEVVGQGTTSADAVDLVTAQKPDILVLDLSIPGSGMTAIQVLNGLRTETRILVLTVSDDESDVLEALRLGANGYVLKGVGGTELAQAVRTLHENGQYLSPSLGARILSGKGRDKSMPPNANPFALSERESAVLARVVEGLSNKEISEALELSEKTVKHYMTSLFRKLGVKSRLELAVLAQKNATLFKQQ